MMIALYHAPTSPYVRKVMVCAHELGVADRVELLASAAHPVDRDARIKAFNPLAKIPAARTAQGQALYDSRVICEYLDAECGGGLFPSGDRRWEALRLQALGDGLLDAALLARYERVMRPQTLYWQDWYGAQMDKISDALDAMNEALPNEEAAFDIGPITQACALGYLDFRFPHFDWRAGRPALAGWFERTSQRPSLRATVPHE